MTTNRFKKLRQELIAREVDGMLISQSENRYYLSGCSGFDGYLLITAEETILATDFRFVEQVKRESPGFTLFEIKGRMATWFSDLVASLNIRSLGFESADITFSFHTELTGILKNTKPALALVPLTGVVEKLRAVKEPGEIAFIQKAAEISDKAIETVTANLKPGVTEMEVAWHLEKTMREMGSQSMPFEVIVGAGPNGALPHAKPSGYRIQTGEPIVIDLGARYQGYSSDLTRTVCIGQPDALFSKIYGIVLQAQQNAIQHTVAGMNGVEADLLARKIIIEAGYDNNFGHGLGHGVGLATHDPAPRLSPLAPNDPLVNGMVFSIEPGIYLPEWGGVRIEDLVTLENGKIKLLSHAKKMVV